jgi:hypothetical protein
MLASLRRIKLTRSKLVFERRHKPSHHGIRGLGGVDIGIVGAARRAVGGVQLALSVVDSEVVRR